MLTERWRPLDLRRRGELGPYDGELIVLHMVPKGPGRSERYIVGRLEVEAGRTWMEGGGNVLLPAEMRKHYELRWVYLPEDEGKKEARKTCGLRWIMRPGRRWSRR